MYALYLFSNAEQLNDLIFQRQ